MKEEAEQRDILLREDKAWDFLIKYQPNDAVRVLKGESRATDEIKGKDEIDFLMEDHFFHLEMPPPPPEFFGHNPYDDDLPMDMMPAVMRMDAAEDREEGTFDPESYLLTKEHALCLMTAPGFT